MSVSVVILTFNEAIHIERALASVSSFASEVVVVDSGSTDATVELAARAGARVLHHPFVTQARSFQWALDHVELTGEWVMRLDADEVVEPELAQEIKERINTLPLDITGIVLKRRHIFMGRFIQHGGRYPLNLLRLWRRGLGEIEDRWMDEHVRLTAGTAVIFKHPFSDINLHDLGRFTEKHNRYATREAVDVLNRRYSLFQRKVEEPNGSSQAVWKRRMKLDVYNKVPFPIAAFGYFLLRYFIQQGFRDGREGLIYHGLQGGWYRFLVGAKTLEFDQVLARLPDRCSRLAALEQMTMLKLSS